MKNSKNLLVVISIIIVGAIARILPHPPNVTPTTAIALFGGALLAKRYFNIIVPLVILFISDLIINNTLLRSYYPETEGLVIWESYMLFIYLGFIAVALCGSWLKNKVSTPRIIGTTLIASILFFLISNFGTWMQGTMYPKNFGGLIACYEAAIPFFRNSIMGNYLFVGIFFGSYYLINSKSYKLAKA